MVEKSTAYQAIVAIFERFEAANLYFGHGTDNAWDESVLLVIHVLGLPIDVDDAELSRELTDSELAQIKTLAQARIETRKPLAYLTHTAYFAGLPFYVNESVMIPRSPIAELIENQFSPWIDVNKIHRVLDLCTGSGCIAIACAKAFPEAIIDAVDISEAALSVAKRNVEMHAVNDQVNLIHSNLFQNLPETQYDIIVSNPPYVGEAEMETLPQEYQHEPTLAFEAAEEGLSIVLNILQRAPKYLSEDGILIVEVGNSRMALEKRLPQMPFIWLEFSRGGEGVFLLTKSDL